MPEPIFADLLLPLPLDGTYTYSVNPEMAIGLVRGMRVIVPFGKKKFYTALVIKVHHQKPAGYQVREIISVLDARPVVLDSQLTLWKWMSEYYMCTLGEVFKAALPVQLKLESKTRTREATGFDTTGISVLNPAQKKALQEIQEAVLESDVVLLHGVTSSGKTELYIHLIQEAMNKGQQVLYLLPEIALTTQIIGRLRAVFGSHVAVYHSKYSNAERIKAWNRLLGWDSEPDKQVQLVIGVRSAVFLPFIRAGLIIIDEEHENTYKQFDPAPRYHARDTAIMLARQQGGKVILGTATPSLETYYNCRTGKYKLVELNERYLNLQLPEISVVNTRELYRRKKMQSHFSPSLIKSIGEALNNGEQVILFQNRRGFSLYLTCEECGEVPRCRYCDVSLTYHKKTSRLYCHYCGFHTAIPIDCPVCNHSLRMKGFGTEKIEEEIALIFPSARIERMDLDATRSRKAYEKLIARFEMRESDILVGTQMVSKGLDFENVKLVGVMDADTMINYPDFRAHERSFQLMAQVSGRSGRKNSRGKVIIQTSDENHPVIQQVIRNDYLAMYNSQIDERRKFHYPPFSRLLEITLKHRNIEQLDLASAFLAALLQQTIKEPLMGPEYPLVSRIQNLYLKRILIKVEKSGMLPMVKARVLAGINETIRRPDYRSVQVRIDVDPY